MTVSPSWMVSPPRGMMIWSPRVMQHSSRLGFRCSSLQGDAGGWADLVDGELQRLDPVVQDAVEGLDVAAGLVQQRADVLDDEVAGHVLGVDDAAQIEAVQNLVELQPVDLGHALGWEWFAGEQGQRMFSSSMLVRATKASAEPSPSLSRKLRLEPSSHRTWASGSSSAR